MATFTRFTKHWYVTLSFNKGSFAFVSAVVITEEILTTNSITRSTLKVGSTEGRPNQQFQPSIMKRDERQHNIFRYYDPSTYCLHPYDNIIHNTDGERHEI